MKREDTISPSAAMRKKEVHVVEKWSLLFSTGGKLADAARYQGLPIPKGAQGLLGAPTTHRDNQNSNHLPRTASQPCQVYKARTPPSHHSSMVPHLLGERTGRQRSSVKANCAPPFTLDSRVSLIIS